jgi:hypothetical protein
MPNIFKFSRSSASIEPMGSIEIRLSQWNDVDVPLEIRLYETDIHVFERNPHMSATAVAEQTSEPEGDYLGKICCSRITRSGSRLYCENPVQVNDGTGTVQPIRFKLKIPSGPNDGDSSEFMFRVRGETESRFEILIKIVQADTGDRLAPSANKFMVAGVRGIVMPRLLQVVQPYFRLTWQPPPEASQPASVSQAMKNEVIEHIKTTLANASWNITAIMNEDLYSSEETDGQEDWVRAVVEYLTGSPYKRSQLAFGGGAKGWRDHLRSTGEYPVCNVCDQLSDVIQWRRGVDPGYIDGGINMHRNHYRNDSGAVLYENYNEALSNAAEWARPGATIFFDSIPPGGHSGTSSPQHENTIIRTKGQGDDLKVQLFDYGGNISGFGAGRGYAGTLLPVAQESGWISPANAIGLIGRERFMAVGWRPYNKDSAHWFHNPLGTATLILTQVSDGAELARMNAADLYSGSSAPASGTIEPLSYYLYALSNMPHSAHIKATFKIESSSAIHPDQSIRHLADIETGTSGETSIVSRT